MNRSATADSNQDSYLDTNFFQQLEKLQVDSEVQPTGTRSRSEVTTSPVAETTTRELSPPVTALDISPGMSLDSFDPLASSKNQSPVRETLNITMIQMLENPESIISSMKKGKLKLSNEGLEEACSVDDDSHLNSVENIFKPNSSSKSKRKDVQKTAEVSIFEHVSDQGAIITDVSAVAPKQLAMQIALCNAKLFRGVTRAALESNAWSASDKWTRAPSIVTMIDKFNKITLWASTEILNTEDPKARLQKIIHFIETAQNSMQLNDYNGVKMLVAALQFSPVHRLEKTWNMLPKNEKQIFDKLVAIMSPEDNSTKYRKRLHQAGQQPAVPFLGVHLGDLVYLHEAKKKELSRKDFEAARKRESQAATIIDTLLQIQARCHYDFAEIRPIQNILNQEKYISELQTFVENQHYIQSLNLEPKAGSVASTTSSPPTTGGSGMLKSTWSISDILSGDDSLSISGNGQSDERFGHSRSASQVHSRQQSGSAVTTATAGRALTAGNRPPSSSDSNHSVSSAASSAVSSTVSHVGNNSNNNNSANVGTAGSATPRPQKTSFLARFRLSMDASSVMSSSTNSSGSAATTQQGRPSSPEQQRKPVLSYPLQQQLHAQQSHVSTEPSVVVSLATATATNVPPQYPTEIISSGNDAQRPRTPNPAAITKMRPEWQELFNNPLLIKEGQLIQKHRLLPTGQKNPKRQWVDGWFRLFPGALIGYYPKKLTNEPLCIYDLSNGGVHIEVAHDYMMDGGGGGSTANGHSNNSSNMSSIRHRNRHKHVLRLQSAQYGEVLLESRTAEDMYGWLAQLQRASRSK